MCNDYIYGPYTALDLLILLISSCCLGVLTAVKVSLSGPLHRAGFRHGAIILQGHMVTMFFVH